jgi:hypothetical protein
MQPDCAASALEYEPRGAPDKGIASTSLIALERFVQEGVGSGAVEAFIDSERLGANRYSTHGGCCPEDRL